MNFFDNFPLITYHFDDSALYEYKLRHIIRRFKVDDVVKSNVLTYQDYLIAEGDSPDQVSMKVYGRPDWHWIILLYNDIVNPLQDWPRSSDLVMSTARKKYNVSRQLTFTNNSINVIVDNTANLYPGASITGVGIPAGLYIESITGNTLKTNLISSFSGVKTAQIDTILATHHVENRKGLTVDLSVYTGTDLSYIRNIDVEERLNNRYRKIKIPLKAHAAKIELEASTILKGA